MNNPLITEKNLILKNKLDAISLKISKLLEFHNELKHILSENVIFNDQIMEEKLFLDIEKKLNEMQLELNSIRNDIKSNL